MFLDEEPYIRFWRPTYRVLRPVIRPVKAVVVGFFNLLPTGGSRHIARIEAQIARLESSHQAFYAMVEQVLAASLSDRQTQTSFAGMAEESRATGQALLSTVDRLSQIEERIAASAAESTRTVQNYCAIMEQVAMSLLSDRQPQGSLEGVETRLAAAITEGSQALLAAIEARLDSILRSLAAIEPQLPTTGTDGTLREVLPNWIDRLNKDNAAQWLAIERLLLAFLAGNGKTLAAPSADTAKDSADRAVGAGLV